MILKIENFTCLQKIEIEINGLTVIIGEQASGKSITSKIYFFLRDVLSDKISDSIVNLTGLKSLNSSLRKEFSIIFPDYSWKHQKFSILLIEKLSSKNEDTIVSIQHDPNGSGIRFIFSDNFKEQYRKIYTNFKKLKIERENLRVKEKDNSALMREISLFRLFITSVNEANSNLLESVTYIPSGRSFFSTIYDNVFGFLSENIGIDPFLKSFGKNYEFAKEHILTLKALLENINHEAIKQFDKLSHSVLKGDFTIDKKEGWIISDNRKIAVANASSGQQEALPLILVLRKELMGYTENRSKTIIVEEPEAHLFPVSQKAIVEILFLIKEVKKDLNFIITTHSPYILSCMNNGLLKSKSDVKINAYFISNGFSTNITDSESGLINGEELDKISSEIAEEFYASLENIK